MNRKAYHALAIVAVATLATLVVHACTLPGPESEVCADNSTCPPGWVCALPQAICVAGVCGNEILDPGEECDDGNKDNSDDCTAQCQEARCGDGFVQDNVEVCDGFNPETRRGCSEDCKSFIDSCGDGITTGDEFCDTFGISTLTCDSDCTEPACNDEVFNPAFEACDDGGMDTTKCNADCTLPACGDGIPNVAAGEQCDDGEDSETCNGNCTLYSEENGCGDGYHNTLMEECETDVETALCNTDCTIPRCGDGIPNAAAGEQCDEGVNGEPTNAPNCDADCTFVVCGDGFTNRSRKPNGDLTEECDSGGGDTPSCDSDCTAPVCGDGHVNVNAVTGDELCDPGPMDSADCNGPGAPFNIRCMPSRCGDGYVNARDGEQCDGDDNPSGCLCELNCRCP